MRKSLLLFSLIILITTVLHAQKEKDSASVALAAKKSFPREITSPNITIYPVPVREGTFSVKSDKDMSAVKVTNMIGQDIFRAQYRSPLPITKVLLNNPSRGIYLVTISFADGTRIVRKIMIENPE